MEHWGTGEGAVQLEQRAGEADREHPPPAACSRMRSRTQGSLFHWQVLESEDHSHHLKQWRLAWCLAVSPVGDRSLRPVFGGEAVGVKAQTLGSHWLHRPFSLLLCAMKDLN